MSWNLLGDAGWTAAAGAGALAVGSAVKAWLSLRRYQIGQRSETDRFTLALEGSSPQQRPEIIRAYSGLARPVERTAARDDRSAESAAHSLLDRLLPTRPKE